LLASELLCSEKRRTILAIIAAVAIGNRELFALRLLLLNSPARGWEVFRTVNDRSSPSFSDAARGHGLILDIQHEAEIAIENAIVVYRPPRVIPFLFA
jgi:hypothetical protein